jgi:hypothetical protein
VRVGAFPADGVGLDRLLDAIERLFGTTIDAAAFGGDACLADAVAALNVRVEARTVSPGW